LEHHTKNHHKLNSLIYLANGVPKKPSEAKNLQAKSRKFAAFDSIQICLTCRSEYSVCKLNTQSRSSAQALYSGGFKQFYSSAQALYSSGFKHFCSGAKAFYSDGFK
jgi:hypothetical protein